MIWLIRPMLIKIWSCIVGNTTNAESFLRLNITQLRIYFHLGSSAQIFTVLAFETILFAFRHKSWRKNTKIFPVEPLFCMSYIKCLSKCLYSKEPVLPCAPKTLILTFVPISDFLQIYPFKKINSWQYKPCIWKTKNLLYYFERDKIVCTYALETLVSVIL